MSVSDRIYMLLGSMTNQHQAVRKLERLVGVEPLSEVVKPAAQAEYVAGITLDEPANPFDQRLAVYGNVAMSTFSILA